MLTNDEFIITENKFQRLYYETLVELLKLKIEKKIDVLINIELLQEAILNLDRSKSYSKQTINTRILSTRENEVLVLILNGNTSEEIAKKLYIEINTVKKHTGNILQKLECKNRFELVSRFRINLV